MFGLKKKYEWPNCESPTEGGLGYGALSCNGTQYKKSEVSPGKWEWVQDIEAMNSMADRENHRRDLFWALRSRILTDDEMKEVVEYGNSLNIELNQSYFPEEKFKELNEALFQQHRLRSITTS